MFAELILSVPLLEADWYFLTTFPLDSTSDAYLARFESLFLLAEDPNPSLYFLLRKGFLVIYSSSLLEQSSAMSGDFSLIVFFITTGLLLSFCIFYEIIGS